MDDSVEEGISPGGLYLIVSGPADIPVFFAAITPGVSADEDQHPETYGQLASKHATLNVYDGDTGQLVKRCEV